MPDLAATWFPIRSNAHSLVSGSGVAGVRRRIKLASVISDQLWLDEGTLDVQAGPMASAAFWVPPNPNERPNWQTPAERGSSTNSYRMKAWQVPSAPTCSASP